MRKCENEWTWPKLRLKVTFTVLPLNTVANVRCIVGVDTLKDEQKYALEDFLRMKDVFDSWLELLCKLTNRVRYRYGKSAVFVWTSTCPGYSHIYAWLLAIRRKPWLSHCSHSRLMPLIAFLDWRQKKTASSEEGMLPSTCICMQMTMTQTGDTDIITWWPGAACLWLC